jgi:hypothetical protein
MSAPNFPWLLLRREASNDKSILRADFQMACPESVGILLVLFARHYGLEIPKNGWKVSIAPIRLHLLPACCEVSRSFMSGYHV